MYEHSRDSILSQERGFAHGHVYRLRYLPSILTEDDGAENNVIDSSPAESLDQNCCSVPTAGAREP